jgi:hypothetical protein
MLSHSGDEVWSSSVECGCWVVCLFGRPEVPPVCVVVCVYSKQKGF